MDDDRYLLLLCLFGLSMYLTIKALDRYGNLLERVEVLEKVKANDRTSSGTDARKSAAKPASSK